MVERFHRVLKAALKCHALKNKEWVDALPIVLLGIRTAVKEDLQASAAELVYGSTLRVPGDFFNQTSIEELNPSTDFVNQIKQHMQQLVPKQPKHHNNNTNRLKPAYIHNDLQQQENAQKSPGTPAQNLPEASGSTESTAGIPASSQIEPSKNNEANAQRVTRSGRRVHFPARFED
ncbi:uncharacterized protein LOC123293080 [Chrysoperla carnea]|uniref:uncharacterized protein LOC123293080 n=1 Tax=Chrysoperla carnea TaxID=189513 RepID=UPI001D08704A|nr:uncharacterized protein LOC123293080 [Chrysoperla carnea]